jgi:hypothetical protein
MLPVIPASGAPAFSVLYTLALALTISSRSRPWEWCAARPSSGTRAIVLRSAVVFIVITIAGRVLPSLSVVAPAGLNRWSVGAADVDRVAGSGAGW